MAISEEEQLASWMPPTDAYVLAKRAYDVHASRNETCEAMPFGTTRRGPAARGGGKGDLDARVVEVHFGEYLKAARALEQAQRDRVNERYQRLAKPTRSNQTLEARVAALEAAFDALLKTTKEVAE